MITLNIVIFAFLLIALVSSVINKDRTALGCGLFGFSGHDLIDINRFKIGLWDNQSRGEHSTGVYGNKIYKEAKPAAEFIQSHKALVDAAQAHEVIGHTRYATMGEKNKDNAHPFEYGKIIGTHNGWCVNTEQMCEKYNVEMPTVDSQLIYKILEATNYDFNSLAGHIGQMALAFVMDEKLHIFRRDNKPLYIGQCEEGIYYSSRITALSMIGAENIAEVEPDIIFVYKQGIMVDAIKVEESFPRVPEAARPYNWRNHVKDHEKYVPLPVSTYGTHTGKKETAVAGKTTPTDTATSQKATNGSQTTAMTVTHKEVTTGGDYTTKSLKSLVLFDDKGDLIEERYNDLLPKKGNEPTPVEANFVSVRQSTNLFHSVLSVYVESEDGEPVNGATVFTSLCPEYRVYTNGNGIGNITMGRTVMGKPYEVNVIDHNTAKQYVANMRPMVEGNVMEIEIVLENPVVADATVVDKPDTCCIPEDDDDADMPAWLKKEYEGYRNGPDEHERSLRNEIVEIEMILEHNDYFMGEAEDSMDNGLVAYLLVIEKYLTDRKEEIKLSLAEYEESYKEELDEY